MDLAIAHYLNQLGRGSIDGFTDDVCEVPLLIALWALLAFVAFRFDRKDGRRVVIAVLIAIGLHFLISEGLLKHLVLTEVPMRVRPYLAHPDLIRPVGYQFTDSSFPSSHAASTAAVLTVFGWAYLRTLPLAVGFSLLMCFSRVHNGMHYPTDVLSGTLLGLAYGTMAIRLSMEIERRRGLAKASAPIDEKNT
jgi:undecaprenyl-diphosphatase